MSALAQKLEQAEAEAAVSFVEARGGTPCWERIGGAWALFDGAGSPVTQAFGFGLFEPAEEGTLDRIEQFFRSRGAAVDLEVSPLAGVAAYAMLARRGYVPVELSTVLYLPREAAREDAGEVSARIARPEELSLWARVSAEAWAAELPELREFLLEMGAVIARRKHAAAWLGFLEGEPVAAASVSVQGAAAHLAGAATLPRARRRGAQGALLAARLRYAWDQGCEMATMAAEPGSASQRNAERNGFRVAYTRTKWHRE